LIFLSQIQNILPIERLYQKAEEVIDDNRFQEIYSIKDFSHLLNRTLNWVEYVKKIIEQEEDIKVKKSILNKISLFYIPDKIDVSILKKLNTSQIKALELLRNYLINQGKFSADEIQNKIFQIAKVELKIKPKVVFEAIYLIILGKKYGPRLGPFLSILDKDWLLDRLELKDK